MGSLVTLVSTWNVTVTQDEPHLWQPGHFRSPETSTRVTENKCKTLQTKDTNKSYGWVGYWNWGGAPARRWEEGCQVPQTSGVDNIDWGFGISQFTSSWVTASLHVCWWTESLVGKLRGQMTRRLWCKLLRAGCGLITSDGVFTMAGTEGLLLTRPSLASMPGICKNNATAFENTHVVDLWIQPSLPTLVWSTEPLPHL